MVLTNVLHADPTITHVTSVCDLVSCDLPEVPHCENGQTVVLKNPGECQPIHECGRLMISLILHTRI